MLKYGATSGSSDSSTSKSSMSNASSAKVSMDSQPQGDARISDRYISKIIPVLVLFRFLKCKLVLVSVNSFVKILVSVLV
jgi:hypothetical protein